MDTQNTPIHPNLWHRDFWLLSVSNLLLAMSVYMFIPILPLWLTNDVMSLSKIQVGVVMGAYGLGLYALGAFCSYWIQKYRRSRVCMRAIFAMIIFYGLQWWIIDKGSDWHLPWWCLVGLRFLLGAAFGVAQMVQVSTLVIDTAESFQRTEACHAAAWFTRFALSLGPLSSLLLSRYFSYNILFVVAIGLSLLSVLLLRAVPFPFRAPDDDVRVLSLDRFFLPQGKWLFLNLLLVTIIVGLLMSLPHTAHFYCMLMGGFLLALLSEKYVFADADLKSEAITGLFALVAAIVMLLWRGTIPVVAYLTPTLIGMGMGLIGSRFLLFFIKLSQHCERGTSQSTFFLAWETGIWIGLFLGYSFCPSSTYTLLYYCLPLTIISLLCYHFFIHPWYMTHKNR